MDEVPRDVVVVAAAAVAVVVAMVVVVVTMVVVVVVVVVVAVAAATIMSLRTLASRHLAVSLLFLSSIITVVQLLTF